MGKGCHILGYSLFLLGNANMVNNKKTGGIDMKNDQVSEGLNQIFEIINAKGDTGELKKIVEKNCTTPDEEQEPSD
jgi:hypothetical protein